MEIERGHVRVSGVRLEFARFGAPDRTAPSLILLHEGLGCVQMWRDFPGDLHRATGLPVVAYSRQGYGGSDPVSLPRPLDYMRDEARDVLPGLLDRFAPSGAILVGHSDGASIAAIHAASADAVRIRGCVLLAPHFFTEETGLESIRQAREAYETGDLRDRLVRYHGGNVDCAFRGWNDAWLDPEFAAWSLMDELGRIEVPMLVIQGEDDAYGTLRQVDAARTHSRGPVETLVLPDCGHTPFRDRPAETLDAVSRFVRRLTT